MSGHAILAPSSAKMWITCTPSARLNALMPDTSGRAADEGTLAHLLAETMLRYEVGRITENEFQKKVKLIKATNWKDGTPLYDESMWLHCEDYANRILGAMSSKSILLIEKKVHFTDYVPEGSGTTDANIITGDFLDFWDLKYGKGVEVSADENPQLMCYALGVIVMYGWLFTIKRIRLNIYQPRLNNHSVYELTIDELLDWAENTLKPAAKLAWDGKGKLVAGDHCKFCKAKARCTEMAKYSTELAKKDFQNPHLLTDPQLIQMYERLDNISDWIKAVKEYLVSEALRGKKWKGYKLVHGRANRIFNSPEKTEKKLLALGYDNIYTPQKLLGVTELTKIMGLKPFNKFVAPDLHSPKGAPALVPDTDNRADYNSPQLDFSPVKK